MSTYLLDSNVIIDALNDRKNRNRSLLNLAENGPILACCPINVAEVYAGLRPKEGQKTSALLLSLQFYPVTFAVAELAGRLKRDYRAKGWTLTIADTVIAAVALHYQLTLITDNTKDFPMEDLDFYSLPATLSHS